MKMVKCPTCGKELKTLSKSHINSKFHKAALSKKGLSDDQDPALKGKKKKTTTSRKPRKVASTGITTRIEKLEQQMVELTQKVNSIIKFIRSGGDMGSNKLSHGRNESKGHVFPKNVLKAIKTCLKSKSRDERWVDIDDIVSILKANSNNLRSQLFQTIKEMFYKDKIDLAEGGNPKFPIIIQNHKFGRIASRS